MVRLCGCFVQRQGTQQAELQRAVACAACGQDCCRRPADASEWTRLEPPTDRRRTMHDREERIRVRTYEI
jgi:hypothetical protein